MDIMDTSSLTAQDKAIIMCIERIEKLESRLYDLQKQTLIRDIATCESTSHIAIDIFLYLLGAPPADRSPVEIEDTVKLHYAQNNSARARVQELAALVKNDKKLWEMTATELSIPVHYNDMFGDNIYTVLETMTLDELNGFWQYQLQKTKLIVH